MTLASTPAKMDTIKIKLVTIVASSELKERVLGYVKELGALGYTLQRASGSGTHGRRGQGFLDSGIIRVETLVVPEVATKLLQRMDRESEDFQIIAFAQDVEAVPRKRFV